MIAYLYWAVGRVRVSLNPLHAVGWKICLYDLFSQLSQIFIGKYILCNRKEYYIA